MKVVPFVIAGAVSGGALYTANGVFDAVVPVVDPLNEVASLAVGKIVVRNARAMGGSTKAIGYGIAAGIAGNIAIEVSKSKTAERAVPFAQDAFVGVKSLFEKATQDSPAENSTTTPASPVGSPQKADTPDTTGASHPSEPATP